MNTPRWRISAEIGGVALTTSTPSRAARHYAGRRGGHARHSLASPFPNGRGKSVLSRVQWGVRRKSLTTTAKAPPSERKALWLLIARATWTHHRSFFGGALVCLHRLDPQRRKSSIIPRSLSEPVSCSDSSPRLRGTGMGNSLNGVLVVSKTDFAQFSSTVPCCCVTRMMSMSRATPSSVKLRVRVRLGFPRQKKLSWNTNIRSASLFASTKAAL